MRSEANLGVLGDEKVNIVVHGDEPTLSDCGVERLARLKREELASELDELKLRLDGSIDPALAAPAVEQLLSRRHGGQNDFAVTVPARLMEQHRKTQRIFTIVMSAVAGISLLVGGIGIMNIMLASVMERKSEIGLLRSLGTTRMDVFVIYLSQSVIIGILAAIAIPKFTQTKEKSYMATFIFLWKE